MTDPYYTIKIDGWNHMIDWVTTTNISFKDFCMNNRMDYILFSGYASYMEKMASNEERLAFVRKQLHRSEQQLEEYIERNNEPCCRAK